MNNDDIDEDDFKIAMKHIAQEFGMLASDCPYKKDSDCGHPNVEFKCMNCQISICPLLNDSL
jgi:hypothetical protein